MMELPIKATPRLRKEIEDWFEEEGLPYFVLDRMGLRALRHALLRIGPSTLFFLLLEARSLWLLLLYSAVGGVIATLFFSLLSLLTHHPLFSLTRWAVQEVWCQIRNLTLLGWVLGFLLAFVTFLFVQAELWEVVGELHGLPLWIALGLFPILGFLVTIIRVPSEIESAARFHDWTDVRKVLAASKVSNLKHLNRLPYSLEPLPKSPSRREQANVALVILFVLGLQFFVAATMIWIFFVLFGMLALNPNTLAGWIGHCPTGLPATPPLMMTLPLSQELLKVAAFIGAFSGLYFTVQAISNDPNRTDFIDRIEVKVRDLLAVRYVYLAVRWGPKVNYDSQGNTYEATFELPAGINANKAYVCGTAMDSGTPHQPDWRRNRFVLSPNAMSKQKDGRFTCTMRLPVEPGQSYYYFYWLDGKRDGKHAVTDSGFHDKIGSVQYAVIRTDAQDELANQGSLVQRSTRALVAQLRT